VESLHPYNNRDDRIRLDTIRDNGCVLNPVWEGIEFPERHYCYSGRQIMEQQATWNALKNCYPKKAKDPIGGEWG
jgi:hypothetical protein